MDDYLERQLALLDQLIAQYELSEISLNTFVQRIEGVSLAIGSDFWANIISPSIDPLEEVNALALDEQRGFDQEDQKIIQESLANLKSSVNRFRSKM